MKKWFLVISLILFGCTEETEKLPIQGPIVEKVATNLNIPWSINLHDNIFYISERVGTIARIQGSTVVHEPVQLSDNLAAISEAGLLGFVLKPDFDETGEAYAYYTYDMNGEPFNRVVTIKREDGQWQEIVIHLDSIVTGNIHHGGRLEIGPDGLLYVTVGDAGIPSNAQDPSSLNGKILRMKDDGSFEIFSMGHRNPQGLAWDEDGTLFEAEHGQSANDEINLVEQGKNYGYPIIEGDETEEGLESPIITSGSDETWAPSGITFHEGKLYVATLRGESVKVMNIETGEIEQSITGFGRVRDVFSDGKSLYFVTNNTDGRGTPSEDDDVLYRLE
ncbi:PQQ-dependent sugar dehydrogenase [Psychrobacillus sp. INOP01]|uniref:PQQ-dependent sugar dehydrogenase n=1 Tax=Psychrobacillus sp. INOP01 TaxID=2829187 RepID=UPI001BA5F907|nr:PQQ-dependent sugar dehydrogenase [Psychrobacillus sp. INOP01]QUG43163.1 PQQ-dependent sugar dehydrogenase [Psychrobacillus sp. INOP01]